MAGDYYAKALEHAAELLREEGGSVYSHLNRYFGETRTGALAGVAFSKFNRSPFFPHGEREKAYTKQLRISACMRGAEAIRNRELTLRFDYHGRRTWVRHI